MGRYKQAELVRRGISRNTVKMAVQRGTLISDNGKVDDEIPDNIWWFLRRNPDWYEDRIKKGWKYPVGKSEKLDKYLADKGFIEKPKKRKYTKRRTPAQIEADNKKNPVKENKTKTRSRSIDEIKDVEDCKTEQELKELKLREEIKYKQSQTKAAETKQQQLEGKLIHIDNLVKLLKVYIPRYKQSVLTEVKALVNTICDEFTIESAKRAEYISDLERALNDASEQSQEQTIDAIKQLGDGDNATNTKNS